MKKLLSASAAVAALFAAAPAFAGSGYVDLSYAELDAGFVDFKAVNLGGAAATEIGGDWNVQGEAVVHRVDVDFFGPSTSLNYTDAGLHLFKRNDSWAAGVYADSTDVLMMSAWGLGVEGAKYFDRATINGSIGFNKSEGGMFFGSDDVDGWNATAGVTFFATDNISIAADVKHMDVEELDATVWGLTAEFKPDTMPVSFFAGYRGQDENFFGEDSTSWRLGVRWNFGSGSLKERDRTGASMHGGMGFADVLF
ncbi:hypothetical protein [Caulobacter sp. 17J80-11]|uniref:hypothetical protein n=1 Tax=Caulobacter sp. 17J80-11 TaxID=2763502 RepID=UPI0016534BEF|nr:hypothetical protein [Caulobacter sp. 17J80-11]MBC6981434.1 hypothetical protein [Caulobacter sp. 17J80-11]